MQSPDIFLRLFARDPNERTSDAFRLAHNDQWYHKAAAGVAQEPLIASRENTPAVTTDHHHDDLNSAGHLVITFSGILRSQNSSAKTLKDGIVIGTDPLRCHVLLGHHGTPGISKKHYAISVDANLRVWVRDCGSSHGTAVECNGQNGREVRKRESWILADHPGKPDLYEDIVVRTGRLAVGVKLPSHAKPDAQYIKNLRNFVDACDTARIHDEDSTLVVGKLVLNSNPTTAAVSGTTTPDLRHIYYSRTLIGKGAFGDVRAVVQASSGKIFAAKTFLRRADMRQLDDNSAVWVRSIRWEFDILSNHPHANIVEVFEYRETPDPLMIMAYYPMGSMAEADWIKDAMYISASGQVLCGLRHLHQKGIVHRDLKPENILVQREPVFRVVITDLGLASLVPQAAPLTTFCGTLEYTAPEVFPGLSNGHGPLVDVWSLGVMILKWMYGAPDPSPIPVCLAHAGGTHVPGWREWVACRTQQLLAVLHAQDDCILVQILNGMIQDQAEGRWTAHQCLNFGFDQNIFQKRPADGLVVCTDDEERIAVELGKEDNVLRPSYLRSSTANNPNGKRNSSLLFEHYPNRDRSEPSWGFRSPAHIADDVTYHRVDNEGIHHHLPVEPDSGCGKGVQMAALEVHVDHVRLQISDTSVCMRITDGCMDLLEIFNVAHLPTGERHDLSEKVRRLTPDMAHDKKSRRIWMSHYHSNLMSKHLDVHTQLRPLFDYASSNFDLPEPQIKDALSEFLEVFIVLKIERHIVAFRQQDLWVNATHMLKRYSPHARAQIIAGLRSSSNSRVVELKRVPRRYWGLFVCFEDALQLCIDQKMPQLRASLLDLNQKQSRAMTEPKPDSLTPQKERSVISLGHGQSVFTEYNGDDYLPRIHNSWDLAAV